MFAIDNEKLQSIAIRQGKAQIMLNVNGVTSVQAAAAYGYSNTRPAQEAKSEEKTNADNAGVIYEPSKEATEQAVSNTNKQNKVDPAFVEKLKAETEARTQQLRTLVEKLMTGQANAYGNATDIWGFLREGNFTVDAATKAQAQEDISEDGYWGVKQTSDRIVQFAVALAGDDPDNLEKMRSAVEKGYKQAEKTWGGELPEISKKTYDAVMQKFDEKMGIKTE